jgi:amidohydrolase
MGAEDFPYFAADIPGFFFHVGVTPPDQDINQVALNHSPRFFVDESALPLASRALLNIAVDYLQGN